MRKPLDASRFELPELPAPRRPGSEEAAPDPLARPSRSDEHHPRVVPGRDDPAHLGPEEVA